MRGVAEGAEIGVMRRDDEDLASGATRRWNSSIVRITSETCSITWIAWSLSNDESRNG